MPTRRDMEMTVIVVVLLAPVLSMFRLWARKHLATSANEVTRDAATVAASIL